VKNERLMYSIGNVEDKFIIEAKPDATRRVKRPWAMWVSAAACLILVLSFGIFMLIPQDEGTITPADLPPMVFVNDRWFLLMIPYIGIQ